MKKKHKSDGVLPSVRKALNAKVTREKMIMSDLAAAAKAGEIRMYNKLRNQMKSISAST